MQLSLKATLALTALGMAAAHPAAAQSSLPFSGDYTGTQTSFTQLTPTTEEDVFSFTSTDASFGLDQGTAQEFLTVTAAGFSLTPNTTSTFRFTSADGSSVSGTVTSATGTFDAQGNQTTASSLVITSGTGSFRGVTGNLMTVGSSNSNASVVTVHATGTLVPAPVPEASTTASFGLLLALGLGGLVIAARRKKAAV